MLFTYVNHLIVDKEGKIIIIIYNNENNNDNKLMLTRVVGKFHFLNLNE